MVLAAGAGVDVVDDSVDVEVVDALVEAELLDDELLDDEPERLSVL